MIVNVDDFLLHQVLYYLEPKQCRALASCCRRLREVCSLESLWRNLCQMHVKGFSKYTNDDLCSILHSIGIPGFYQLFCVTREMKFDLQGYFTKGLDEGGLFCIRRQTTNLLQEKLKCYQYINGVSCARFNIAFDSARCCLIYERDDFANLVLKIDSALNVELKHGPIYSFLSSATSKLKFQPIGPLIDCSSFRLPCGLGFAKELHEFRADQALKPTFEGLNLDVLDCLGFHTTIYGPHGQEILYLSLRDDPAQTGSGQQSPKLQLTALKITGDKNVPAGNVSFVIDLDSSVNIAEEMNKDPRGLLYYDPIRTGAMHVTHANARQSHLSAWYRGRGQINRIPGTWEPEWVGCSLWVYSEPLAASSMTPATAATPANVRCSVVWDDLDSRFRHTMDIQFLDASVLE